MLISGCGEKFPHAKRARKCPGIPCRKVGNYGDIAPITSNKIDVDMFQCELSNSGKGQLAELIDEFGNLFTSSQGELGCTSIVQHEIVGKGSTV